MDIFNYGIRRWNNRVAFISGASEGIGAEIARRLVQIGVVVIGCARNISNIQVAAEVYKKLNYDGKLFAYQCDISKETEVKEMFQWIQSNQGGIDICINCAGCGTFTPLLEITSDVMSTLMSVNILGLTLCSKFSWKSMLEKGVTEGHIININSMAGHVNPGQMNFYSATKFAVTGLTEGLRKEICASGKTGIRVSSISPGLVKTNLLGKSLGNDVAEKVYANLEALQPEDIAETIIFVLAAPKRMEIFDITMRPHGEISFFK